MAGIFYHKADLVSPPWSGFSEIKLKSVKYTTDVLWYLVVVVVGRQNM